MTSPPPSIGTIVVPSADRLEALTRCLPALSAQFRAFQHEPRLVVVDGSRRDAAAVRSFVTGFEGGAEYLGAEEAGALTNALREAGVPSEMLRWGVSPGDVGSNRNLAVLTAAGGSLLMLDDDVRFEPWGPERPGQAITLAGHADLREWRFFASRQQAFDAAGRSEVDLARAHGQLLGAPLAEILGRSAAPPNSERICSHLKAMLDVGAPARVRVTFSGLAGDGATYCPSRLLLTQGETRRALFTDPVTFRRAMTSREVHRIAPQLTLTHDPACMAYCMGISTQDLVPPFIPLGRNEDGVWGAMLALCDPHALFAQLPYGVLHDSTRESLYPISDRTRSAQETRISELLLLELQQMGRSVPEGTMGEHLAWIGGQLIALGELPPRTFADRVVESVLTSRRRDLALMAAAPPDVPLPDYWRSAIEAYRDTLKESTRNPLFFVPVECRNATVNADRFNDTQSFLRRFGEFAIVWPRIWHAAVHLNARRRDR